MIHISDRNRRESQNTGFYSVMISENRAVCEMLWENMVKSDRLQMKMQYGACPLPAG